MQEAVHTNNTKIAILGGGEEELSILSEFHRAPGVNVVAIYDRDPRAVAIEIAEIIGVPTYSDKSFIEAFRTADYIIVTEKRDSFREEIDLLISDRKQIINPSEAVSYLVGRREYDRAEPSPWPSHLEEALQYINRITDRERLLKWLLEISVRAVEASSGSIMLYSEPTKELYIGYASGLSEEVIKKTRQRLGEGIAGKVAQNREPTLIKQTIDTSLYGEERDRQEIQSAISSPLLHKGRLLGVINVSTNKGEKILGKEDVKTTDLLASQISPILDQHLRIDAQEIRETEYQIRNYLESLLHKDIGFHDKFTFLCKTIAEKLHAEMVTIYTATDEGDWLILGGSDQHVSIEEQSPRVHCIKGSLAKAYLDREEVIMTEVANGIGLTPRLEDGAITSIYMPLVHNEPLGVLVIEFSSLDRLERFFRMKDSLRFQVSIFTYMQLRELRQLRRMESLEELSALTPALMSLNGLSSKVKRIPTLISTLIHASHGSFHFDSPEFQDTSYFQFPTDVQERSKRTEYDLELYEHALSSWEPSCISYMSIDVEMYDTPPLYRSVIIYPIFRQEDTTAIYIGYDKVAASPLNASIFGKHELELLAKVQHVLEPILQRKPKEGEKEEMWTFDDLLKSNMRILSEHIEGEIDRAKRYHTGFTLTVFKIIGLKELFKRNYQEALNLINELSLGIREQVRKTDYFSWIETDIFTVLSLESFQRIGYLEGRLVDFIKNALKKKDLYDPISFYPSSSYVLFPSASETPAELIKEAKDKLP
ncbi:MAG: GAF domain-containing protein [bacterium]|nr:MAG: GAF domain-containing protein [bacterium]